MTTFIRSQYFERVRRGSGRLRAEYAASCPRLPLIQGGWQIDTDEHARVPVSLMGAYVAHQLTRDSRLGDAFNEEARQIGAMSGFIGQALSGMTHTMLRGQDTRVSAGYFRYSAQQRGAAAVRYIDRSGIEVEPKETLLEPSKVEKMLPRIEALARPMARFVSVEPDQQWIRLEFDPSMRALLSEKPVGLRNRNRGAISLVSRSSITFLAEVELREDDTGIALWELPVERVMELQAAALDDQWLMLEHPELCAIGPFPDLFTPGSEALARVEPTHTLAHWLGGEDLQTLAVEPALAVDLMRKFHWMGAPHPVIWRALAEASQ
jgi:hypothetical protein